LAIGGTFVAKTIIELMTGSTIFVDRGHHDFMPVPLAHLIGAIIGIVIPIPWQAFSTSLAVRIKNPITIRRRAARRLPSHG
jgi:hypothetical protein